MTVVVLANADPSQWDFSRVAIIGCPGSGKTTLSNKLQEIFRRPVIHLDKVLWQPNWQMPQYDERAKIHSDIIGADNWIVDGMWKSHLEDRFKRATLIIFLDYKRSLCLRRVFSRRLKYRHKQREDIAEGCFEKLDGEFLRYIWTFRKKARPYVFQLAEQNPDTTVVVIKNPKEAAQLEYRLQEYVKIVTGC